MGKILQVLVFILLGNILTPVKSQYLQKDTLSQDDLNKGVAGKYYYANQYDGYILLYLFENHRYRYIIDVTARKLGVNEGRWSIDGEELMLKGDVNKDSIPVRIEYLEKYNDSLRVKKTRIGMPQNVDGSWLPDSRIFINNDSVYYFTFFDTCVGTFSQIDSIKVDFDGDFKSRWMAVTTQDFKLLKITALINFFPLKTDYFSTRRYRISGNELMLE